MDRPLQHKTDWCPESRYFYPLHSALCATVTIGHHCSSPLVATSSFHHRIQFEIQLCFRNFIFFPVVIVWVSFELFLFWHCEKWFVSWHFQFDFFFHCPLYHPAGWTAMQLKPIRSFVIGLKMNFLFFFVVVSFFVSSPTSMFFQRIRMRGSKATQSKLHYSSSGHSHRSRVLC